MKCIFFLSFSLLSPAIAAERSALIAPSATRPEQHPADHRRRRLSPESDIIDELNSQLVEGIQHPRFTLTAVSSHGALFADNGNNNNNNSPLFEIDVVLTNPSVTDSTSFSFDGSFDHPSPVRKNPTTKLLVADRAESSREVFAVLAVNETSRSVSGIVQKDGRQYRLEQKDGPTMVVEVNYDPPNNNNWTCLVDSTQEHHETAGEAMRHGTAEEKRLRKHRQHEHESDDTSSSSSIFDINNHRRAAKRKLYATDTFPNAWSYQVDLYIQVDNDFVANHDTDTVNMPNTIDYVNALVSAGEIYMNLLLGFVLWVIFDCRCLNYYILNYFVWHAILLTQLLRYSNSKSIPIVSIEIIYFDTFSQSDI